MYVCGMTVYDYCHLGHARVMVVFDMMQRWLRASGYRSHLCAQHHRYRRQDHQARGGKRRNRSSQLTQRFIDGDGRRRRRARRAEARSRAARHATMCRRCWRIIEKLEHNGLAYQAERRRRQLFGARFSGLRQAVRQVAGRSARRRARRRQHRQARPARFRVVEGGQGSPSRTKPNGIRTGARAVRAGISNARRCACDTAGRAFRHSRRRPGSAVSASRERNRAVRRRASATPSSITGCTTASSASTTRRCPSRSATSSPSATC